MRHWIPRSIGFAFVALMLLFATDAGGDGVVSQGIAIVMHLIPAALAALLLALAWRRETIGGALYLSAGALYAAWVLSTGRPLSWAGVIAAPLVAAGVLFILASSAGPRTSAAQAGGRPGT